MGQKKIGGWQGLLKLVAARMNQDVSDDRLDRATETASGHLTRNPKHVVASLRLERLTHEVLDGAISPSGKIALVVAFDDYACGLVTWSREEGLRENVWGELWNFDQEYTLAIFFPHGSEEPAVVARIHDESSDKDVWRLTWGNWFQNLPEMRKEDMCVRAWEEGETRHVAFLENNFIRHYSHPISTPAHTIMVEPDILGGARWIGLVDGYLATITVADGCETVRCAQYTVTLPHGRKVFPSSIGLAEGGLRFVLDSGLVGWSVYHTDGNAMKGSLVPPNDVVFGDGQVFLVRRGPSRRDIMRLGKEGFEKVIDASSPMPEIGKDARIFDFGKTVVVVDMTIPVSDFQNRIWTITGITVTDHRSHPNDLAVERCHHGLAAHRRNAETGEHYVHWEIPSAHKIGRYENFPLYGTPFDRLVAVEDSRGKAIMSWSFTDGTLHVLRYDLPNE